MAKVERGQISIWKCEKNHKTQILLDFDVELGLRNHTLGSKTSGLFFINQIIGSSKHVISNKMALLKQKICFFRNTKLHCFQVAAWKFVISLNLRAL